MCLLIFHRHWSVDIFLLLNISNFKLSISIVNSKRQFWFFPFWWTKTVLQTDLNYTIDTAVCVWVFQRKVCACWARQIKRSSLCIRKICMNIFYWGQLFFRKYIFFSSGSAYITHIQDLFYDDWWHICIIFRRLSIF